MIVSTNGASFFTVLVAACMSFHVAAASVPDGGPKEKVDAQRCETARTSFSGNSVNVSSRIVFFSRIKPEIVSLIDEAAVEAKSDGWDGDDSLKTSQLAVLKAKYLAAMLPVGLPIPEVSVTPLGTISLDWFKSINAQLSLLAPTGDGIAFAAYIDGKRLHGSSPVEYTVLPPKMAEAIALWMDAA